MHSSVSSPTPYPEPHKCSLFDFYYLYTQLPLALRPPGPYAVSLCTVRPHTQSILWALGPLVPYEAPPPGSQTLWSCKQPLISALRPSSPTYPALSLWTLWPSSALT